LMPGFKIRRDPTDRTEVLYRSVVSNFEIGK
jgi:hypothetical protein